MSQVPDFMPVLSPGLHVDPSQGACLMEYVSLLAGERFSDRPSCTHPTLAHAARMVNDALRDRDRHLLVPLIGRLIGTSGHDDDTDLRRALVTFASVRAGRPAWSGRCDACGDETSPECAGFEVSRSVNHLVIRYRRNGGAATELVGFLAALLDEFDRLTGHQPRPLSDDDLRELAQAVTR